MKQKEIYDFTEKIVPKDSGLGTETAEPDAEAASKLQAD